MSPLVSKKSKASKSADELKKSAREIVMLDAIGRLEANQARTALAIHDVRKDLNDFFDLIVAEFEKSIGHNFAGPFKAKLKELADKYEKLYPVIKETQNGPDPRDTF